LTVAPNNYRIHVPHIYDTPAPMKIIGLKLPTLFYVKYKNMTFFGQ
jgi:hypothetical protein